MNNDKIIEQRIKDKNKRIEKAINMRERQICYFNSVNSAISKQTDKEWNWDTFIEDRDKFIELWREWYMENIEPANEEEILPL